MAGLPPPRPRGNPDATDRPAKAVLVGGECDGMAVRLNFPSPPERLVVLLDEPARDANGEPVPAAEAFVAPTTTFPNSAAGRPVAYVRWQMAGLPDKTRVALYVPEGYPTALPTT